MTTPGERDAIEAEEGREWDVCPECNGRGGELTRQDPVGDGIGFETLFDPCPACIAQDKCPSCGGPIDAEYYCQRGCGWTPEDIGAPDTDDYGPDDWGYYPDLD